MEVQQTTPSIQEPGKYLIRVPIVIFMGCIVNLNKNIFAQRHRGKRETQRKDH